MSTTRPGLRGPDDVVAVTGGQDRGARFGLRGGQATIGRGPVMDIVLTDPHVSRRHAVLRRAGGAILVDDLGSTSGTVVNGVRISGPTTLAPGDRVVLGDTELTVLTPGEQPPEPPPPPPPVPPPPPPPPAPAPAAPPETRIARAEVLLPIATGALGLFALVGTWMPVVGDARGTDSVWSLGRAGLRVQAIGAALIVMAGAAAWLFAAARGSGPVPRLVAALAAAVGGGLVAGLPLLLAVVHVEDGITREAGVVLLALAGMAAAGCAIAGVLREARGRTDPPGEAGLALLAAGAGFGGLLAVVSGPLTWLSIGSAELGGLDSDLRAGGWLIPLALAVVCAGGLAFAVARAGEPRAALAVAAGACALAAAALTYTTTTAVIFSDFQMEIGLSLALTGAAIALVSAVVGTVTALAVRPPPPPPPVPTRA
ncbi:MAG: FHA domain-containing protein [Thermoleophilia bacterium]